MKRRTIALSTLLIMTPGLYGMDDDNTQTQLITTAERITQAPEGTTTMDIGITKESRLEMSMMLNNLLASEYVLYTKTWKFHWNVEGKHFGSLHSFFGTQVEQLGKIVDNVAERVRALGVKAKGTLTEFSEETTLPEHPNQNPNDLSMIKLLLNDHEEIIRKLHKDAQFSLTIGDVGTNNFLCNLMEMHEKMAWMLRAHLN